MKFLWRNPDQVKFLLRSEPRAYAIPIFLWLTVHGHGRCRWSWAMKQAVLFATLAPTLASLLPAIMSSLAGFRYVDVVFPVLQVEAHCARLACRQILTARCSAGLDVSRITRLAFAATLGVYRLFLNSP